MSEPLKDDLPRKIAVGAFFESEDYIGQTIERDRTHYHHVRNAVHLEFKRERDQPFDLFGGMVRPLGDDFDLRRREVGIGVHGHPLERQDSPNRDESGQHQHQKPLTQRRLDDSVDHSDVVDTILIIFARVAVTFFKACAILLALQRVRKLQEQAAISDDLITSF